MIDKYAEIQDRIKLYNACKGILRTKYAVAYDPAAYGLNSSQVEQWNNYNPGPVGTTDLGAEVSQGFKYGDPKARNIKSHTVGPNALFRDDNANLITHANYSVNPVENLLNGKEVDKATRGNVYDELIGMGYSPKETAGFQGAGRIAGITGRDAINEKTIGPMGMINPRTRLDANRGGTVYVDDDGNFVNRSMGIQQGRQYGAYGGAAAGAALGGLTGYGVSRGLGLYGKNSNGFKRMLGNALTLGGAVAGGYGGYHGGQMLGEQVGGYLDPQQGKAVKMYSMDHDVYN